MEKIEKKKGKQMIRFRLREILDERGLSGKEAARLTDLTEQTISHLCSLGIIHDPSSIKFDTIEKLCRGLGLQISELIVFEEPTFLSFVKAEGGPLTIAVGSRRCVLIQPNDRVGDMVKVIEGALQNAIGIWDMRALAEVTRQIPWRAPRIEETPCTLPLDEKTMRDEEQMPVTVSRLLQSEGGVVLGLGSPLVSGLADAILLQLQQPFPNLGQVQLPFQFRWDFMGTDQRRYHRFEGPGRPQGIAWNPQGITGNEPLLVQIPSWGAIDAYQRGQRYGDGCVIVVWPTLRDQRRTWFVLVMGFMGPGTMGGASFLFSDRFGNLLSEYLADPAVISEGEDPAPPLFVALKVGCEKQGPKGSREVYPVAVEVVDSHFDATLMPAG
ncbi:MAG: helix-turn-helix transcriptional regulator [Bacteroidota bacterium]|jgi:putative transcriptional regulator